MSKAACVFYDGDGLAIDNRHEDECTTCGQHARQIQKQSGCSEEETVFYGKWDVLQKDGTWSALSDYFPVNIHPGIVGHEKPLLKAMRKKTLIQYGRDKVHGLRISRLGCVEEGNLERR